MIAWVSPSYEQAQLTQFVSENCVNEAGHHTVVIFGVNRVHASCQSRRFVLGAVYLSFSSDRILYSMESDLYFSAFSHVNPLVWTKYSSQDLFRMSDPESFHLVNSLCSCHKITLKSGWLHLDAWLFPQPGTQPRTILPFKRHRPGQARNTESHLLEPHCITHVHLCKF